MNSENSKTIKRIFLGLVLLCMLLILGYIIYAGVKSTEATEKPKVTLTLEDDKKVVIELYPDKAPNTVSHFLNLVNAGYYNDKLFYGRDSNIIHVGRNLSGGEDVPKMHMINSDIAKDSPEDIGYNIDGEFLNNGYVNNNLKHEKYALSLARGNYLQISKSLREQSYNSGGGLFNIVMGANSSFLDGKYAVFGKIIEGRDIIDSIYEKEVAVKETEENKADLKPFKKPIKIKTATTEYKKFKEVKAHKAFNFDEFLKEVIEREMEKK